MKIEPTYIRMNPMGDSRTAYRVPTVNEFDNANSMHIVDVANMMEALSFKIAEVGNEHDHTKVKEPYRTMFYKDLCDAIENYSDFTEGEWYKKHFSVERHHLDKKYPDDVNLIDVLEMLCDHICAGMARTGSYTPGEVPDVLILAYKNTEKMLVESVRLRSGFEEGEQDQNGGY